MARTKHRTNRGKGTRVKGARGKGTGGKGTTKRRTKRPNRKQTVRRRRRNNRRKTLRGGKSLKERWNKWRGNDTREIYRTLRAERTDEDGNLSEADEKYDQEQAGFRKAQGSHKFKNFGYKRQKRLAAIEAWKAEKEAKEETNTNVPGEPSEFVSTMKTNAAMTQEIVKAQHSAANDSRDNILTKVKNMTTKYKEEQSNIEIQHNNAFGPDIQSRLLEANRELNAVDTSGTSLTSKEKKSLKKDLKKAVDVILKEQETAISKLKLLQKQIKEGEGWSETVKKELEADELYKYYNLLDEFMEKHQLDLNSYSDPESQHMLEESSTEGAEIRNMFLITKPTKLRATGAVSRKKGKCINLIGETIDELEKDDIIFTYHDTFSWRNSDSQAKLGGSRDKIIYVIRNGKILQLPCDVKLWDKKEKEENRTCVKINSGKRIYELFLKAAAAGGGVLAGELRDVTVVEASEMLEGVFESGAIEELQCFNTRNTKEDGRQNVFNHILLYGSADERNPADENYQGILATWMEGYVRLSFQQTTANDLDEVMMSPEEIDSLAEKKVLAAVKHVSDQLKRRHVSFPGTVGKYEGTVLGQSGHGARLHLGAQSARCVGYPLEFVSTATQKIYFDRSTGKLPDELRELMCDPIKVVGLTPVSNTHQLMDGSLEDENSSGKGKAGSRRFDQTLFMGNNTDLKVAKEIQRLKEAATSLKDELKRYKESEGLPNNHPKILDAVGRLMDNSWRQWTYEPSNTVGMGQTIRTINKDVLSAGTKVRGITIGDFNTLAEDVSRILGGKNFIFVPPSNTKGEEKQWLRDIQYCEADPADENNWITLPSDICIKLGPNRVKTDPQTGWAGLKEWIKSAPGRVCMFVATKALKKLAAKFTRALVAFFTGGLSEYLRLGKGLESAVTGVLSLGGGSRIRRNTKRTKRTKTRKKVRAKTRTKRRKKKQSRRP